jgi:uncharacterized protein (TIGR03435 family)
MSALCDLLTGMTDKPVMDMTGLSRNYQLALDLSPEEMLGGMARSQGLAFGPGGKLGLRLDARKASVETVLVHRLEKIPTEN